MSLSPTGNPPVKHLFITVLIAVAISLPISFGITFLVNISGIPIPASIFTAISGFIIGWQVATRRRDRWKRDQLRKGREEDDFRASSTEEGSNW